MTTQGRLFLALYWLALLIIFFTRLKSFSHFMMCIVFLIFYVDIIEVFGF